MIAALLAVAQSQALDFDHAGAPVARVVAAMGEAYGAECRADATMARDYVILALRGETFERARTLLARALNATWTEKDGRWTLHRTREQEREDERREDREKIERYAWAQPYVQVPERLTGERAAEFVRLLVQHAATDGGSLPHELTPRTPITRALARIRKELDPAIVSSLNRGPTLFGMRETALVRKMPRNVEAIVREAVADQNALYRLIGSQAASVPDYWTLTRVGPVEDVYLVLFPNEFGPIVDLIVPQADGSGLMMFQALNTVSTAPAHTIEWPESLDVECKLSDLTLELSALPPVRFAPDVERTEPSERLLEVFLDPRRHDPLELAVSEVVFQASQVEGLSYVVVPGPISRSTRFWMKPRWTVREAIGRQFSPYSYRVEREEGAVIVKPLKPSEVREERMSRLEFASALVEVRTRSENLLYRLASAVEGLPSEAAGRVLYLLSDLGRVYSYDHGDMEVLLIYAALTESQRRSVDQGVVVPMTAPFTELLASLVALKVRSQTGGAVELSAFLNKTGAEWSAEALAVARAGSQSRFVMRNRPVQMLYQTNRYRGYYGPAYPTSPESLARLERLSAQDPEFNWGSLLLRPVEQDVLVLSLVDGQREIPVASFKVPALYEGDKFEPLDKSPAWVRERYEAERKRLAAIPPPRERP